MKSLVIRNLATDTLIAMLALAAATLALAGGVEDLLSRGVVPRESVRFLLVAVVPSAVLGVYSKSGAALGRIMQAVLAAASSFAISLVVLFVLHTTRSLRPDTMEYLLTALALFAGMKILMRMMAQMRNNFPGLVKRVLIVGDGPLAEQMKGVIKGNGDRYRLLGQVGCYECLNEANGNGNGDRSNLLRVARNFMADKLVVSLSERRGAFPVEEMLSCKLGGIDVMDAPSFYEQASRKLLIENITPSWFIFNPGFQVGLPVRAAKRLSDIVGALVGMAVALPLVPFIVAGIKLGSPGPVLFTQTRVGKGDRPFTMRKFRTMRQDAESMTGAVWSQVNDPRITRVGGFLRKTRLDEIPQLMNILGGTMSLVGPRPERPEFVAKLKERIPYYSERHHVKPGLTGWAQVRYPYGSSVEDAIEKLRYDLYYIKHLSLFLDLGIIFRTVGVVLFGKGGR
jgi:sugar transferase (PEP-CTERM system associated)